jgi:hypothetical protein
MTILLLFFFHIVAQLSASSILDDTVNQYKDRIKAELKVGMTEVIQSLEIHDPTYVSSDLLFEVGAKHTDQIIEKFSPIISQILLQAEKNEDGKYYRYDKTSQLWQRKKSVSITNGARINLILLKRLLRKSLIDMISAGESDLIRRGVASGLWQYAGAGADNLLSTVGKFKNNAGSLKVALPDDWSFAPPSVPNAPRSIKQAEKVASLSDFMKLYTGKAADKAAHQADYLLSKLDDWSSSPVSDDAHRFFSNDQRYRRTKEGDIYNVELRRKWREKRREHKQRYLRSKLEQSRENSYYQNQKSHDSYDRGYDSDDATVVASGVSHEARQLLSNLDRRDNAKILRQATNAYQIPSKVQRLLFNSLDKKIVQAMDVQDISNILLSYIQKIATASE